MMRCVNQRPGEMSHEAVKAAWLRFAATEARGRSQIYEHLAEAVEIDREVYLAGIDGKIELWAKHLYERLDEDMADFAELAAQIMGNDTL